MDIMQKRLILEKLNSIENKLNNLQSKLNELQENDISTESTADLYSYQRKPDTFLHPTHDTRFDPCRPNR